jgi:Icc-related predicted phosphoesterase
MARKRFIPGKMKLLFSSDLHGLDSAYYAFAAALKDGDYDLGALGGDLMTYPSRSEIEQTGEIHQIQDGRPPQAVIEHALLDKQKYYRRVIKKSGKLVVFLMGNDDGLLGKGNEWTNEKDLLNVNQLRIEFGSYNIVGYQYTTPFVGGTFEKPENEQIEDFRQLEKLMDENTILITHGPAWGVLDAVDGDHVGSMALRELIDRKEPRLHLFGHVHSNFGIKNHAVNGSYPHSQKFISIDVDSLVIKIV